MSDSIVKVTKLMGLLVAILFIVGCGSTNKGIKENTLSPSETNLTFLLQELKENPKDPSVYYKLSKVYADLDSLDYALVSVDTALSLDPKMNPAKIMRGSLLLKKNRIKEGYSEYLDVLKSETGDQFVDEIRLHLGQPYPIHRLTNGDYNNAFPYFSPTLTGLLFNRIGMATGKSISLMPMAPRRFESPTILPRMKCPFLALMRMLLLSHPPGMIRCTKGDWIKREIFV